MMRRPGVEAVRREVGQVTKKEEIQEDSRKEGERSEKKDDNGIVILNLRVSG